MRLPDLALLAPLPAIAVGAAIASRHGVAPAAFLPGLLAVVPGAALAWAAAWSRELPRWASSAALVLVAATLLAPGVEGVHRWLPLGPVRLNASAALAPWLLAAALAEPGLRTLAALVLAQLVHLAQPDAAQATALAVGALPIVLSGRTALGAAAATLLTGLAAGAWLRDDPLQPVAHVEGILDLAWQAGPAWLGAALLALALAFLPLARRPAALGYLAAATLCTFGGAFPVPLLGAGAAHVLGWYGLLALARR
ncbi:MAG: hypothetical protein QM704_18500 [Anaeromyxobacteraceae bacterium]